MLFRKRKFTIPKYIISFRFTNLNHYSNIPNTRHETRLRHTHMLTQPLCMLPLSLLFILLLLKLHGVHLATATVAGEGIVRDGQSSQISRVRLPGDERMRRGLQGNIVCQQGNIVCQRNKVEIEHRMVSRQRNRPRWSAEFIGTNHIYHSIVNVFRRTASGTLTDAL